MEHPHDDHLRFCWTICRYGIRRVEGEEDARERVLGWIERMRPRFPGSPHLEAWARIVAGRDPDAARTLREVTDYFALPPEERSRWGPLIQSQPFACILPGRTTRERRAILSRLQK